MIKEKVKKKTATSKKTKSKKLYKLKEVYGDTVESLGIVIKDIKVGKNDTGAVVFMTLRTDKGPIEANMALESNKDFKRHIIAMIDQIVHLGDGGLRERT